MNSVLLMSTARLLTTLMLMFSVFLLVRGHNAPGGGFIAGLVVASALALYALAFDVRSARLLIRIHPQQLIAIGLLVSVISGLPGLINGNPFMSGLWFEIGIGSNGIKLGTPLLFDLGVFMIVAGMAMIAILWLAEEEA